MKMIRSVKAMQAWSAKCKASGQGPGFVPTMGALHEGHLSLIRAARKENRKVAVSIFVNPTQFGPREDLKAYPRPFARDRRLLEQEKVDALFYPSVREMYPVGCETRVEGSRDLTGILCGSFRPGHFDGVTTVVAKLLNAVDPDRVYFGQKDYQQGLIIRQMIRDLDFQVTFRMLPIIREADGLALSSRNIYLTAADRERALAIPAALKVLAREIRTGVRGTRGPARRKVINSLRSKALKKLRAAVDDVQYLEIRAADSLQALRGNEKRLVALTACRVGKTRLIDNAIIRPS